MHPLLQSDQPFPILAWIGPGIGDQGSVNVPISEKTMGDLADAGFNLSLSAVNESDPCRDLDIARDAGVRLVVSIPGLRVGKGTVTDAWRERMKAFVAKVRGHDGLFGYYVADEPKRPLFEDIGKAFVFLREQDPEHLVYYNHWMTNMSFCGLRSYEEMWETFHEMCQPDFVSMDCYPIEKGCSEKAWSEGRSSAFAHYFFPRHKAKHQYHYYESLEIQRQFSRILKVPIWGFTRSQPGYTLETAEGEMRYQLMTALAYGAKGLQYFSYAHANMMVGPPPECQPNELARIAKKLNRELRAWEPTLKKLRSIGVYHHPANHFMTRPLDQYKLGNANDLCVLDGDDVVVGQFVDDDGWEYALICNRTPFEPGAVTFHFGTDGMVEELSALDGQWARAGHRMKGCRRIDLSFSPGQGRLFRFQREITPTQMEGV